MLLIQIRPLCYFPIFSLFVLPPKDVQFQAYFCYTILTPRKIQVQVNEHKIINWDT